MKAPSAPLVTDHDLSTDDLARIGGGFWNSDLYQLNKGEISQDEYDRRQAYYTAAGIVF
jgi:hypothetical protein